MVFSVVVFGLFGFIKGNDILCVSDKGFPNLPIIVAARIFQKNRVPFGVNLMYDNDIGSLGCSKLLTVILLLILSGSIKKEC